MRRTCEALLSQGSDTVISVGTDGHCPGEESEKGPVPPIASCQGGCQDTAQVAILHKNWTLLSVQTPHSFHGVPSALGLATMPTFFP